MALSIRNTKVKALAKRLAEQQGSTMTQAIATALEQNFVGAKPVFQLRKRRDLPKKDLKAFVEKLQEEFARDKRPGGRRMSKDEIDEMWWG